PFLRDITFFTMAITLTLVIIWDGKIYLWESIILVLFYMIYVSVIVIGNWWMKKLKRQRWQEQKARDEYNQNLVIDTSNLEVPIEDDYDSQDAYGYDSYDETDRLLPDAERNPNYHTHPTPRSQDEAQEYSFTSVSEAVDQAIHFHNPQQRSPRSPLPRGTRPSFFGAIEFRDVVNSLKLNGRSYPSDYYAARFRSRTLPYRKINNATVRRRSWASYSGTAETHNPVINDGT
ncbi:18410_t:CDS:2, partial [Acaulospora morrowiae]